MERSHLRRNPPKVFGPALQNLQVDRAYVVSPVLRRYPLAERVEVMPVAELAGLLES